MSNISHIADANGINALLQNACKEAGVEINDITSMADLQKHLGELKSLLPPETYKSIAEKLNVENMQNVKAGNEGVVGSSVSFLNGLFAAMLGAFWAYEGWNNVGYLGGEVKNPQRNIPLGLTIGVLIVMAIYTLINFSYLYAMPIEDLINVHFHIGRIGAVEVLKTYMSGGVLLVLGIIALANFNTTNNSILASPRVTYAMAVDGLFFKQFAAVHPKYKTPTLAILFMGFWASCFVLSGQFDALTDMLVFASFIFYFMAAVGVFILRKKMPDAPRTYKVSLIFPAIFAIFSAGLVCFTVYNDFKGAFSELPDYSLDTIFSAFFGMNSVRGLLLMLLGVPLYFYLESKNEEV
jgi:APA family basic amino acid/polyamine antiporter